MIEKTTFHFLCRTSLQHLRSRENTLSWSRHLEVDTALLQSEISMEIPMKITLKPRQEKQLLKAYPWVFANQIESREGSPDRGAIVAVFTHNGKALGKGFYHDTSQIAVRMVTFDPLASIDSAFFKKRLDAAYQLRTSLYGSATHYRLLFSESDGFPGTIVDKYGAILTWTSLSYGMEQRRDELLDLLEALVQPEAIIERNDAWLRSKDDLPPQQGLLRGTYSGQVMIEENGVKFSIDPLHGPKTGFFMDQRHHRFEAGKYARGKRVLDVCCADGGFGLQAAFKGASHVRFIDSSGPALDRVRHNASINHITTPLFFDEADALVRMEELVHEKATFDLVILDPPAFAKSRRHIESATRAYQRLNINAFQLLEPGGILATSSCSLAIKEADFLKIIRYAARKTGSGFRVLYRGFQPPDHPVLDSMPETHYLKFFILQKLSH